MITQCYIKVATGREGPGVLETLWVTVHLQSTSQTFSSGPWRFADSRPTCWQWRCVWTDQADNESLTTKLYFQTILARMGWPLLKKLTFKISHLRKTAYTKAAVKTMEPQDDTMARAEQWTCFYPSSDGRSHGKESCRCLRCLTTHSRTHTHAHAHAPGYLLMDYAWGSLLCKMLVMGSYTIAVSQSKSWLEVRPRGQSPPSTAP